MGHNSFVYLDDGFGSQPERASAVAAAFIQRKELDSSGLLVNEEKSHWVPMQVGEWLGFVINTISMTFQIPEKKVCKLKRLLNSAIQFIVLSQISQDSRFHYFGCVSDWTYFPSSD